MRVVGLISGGKDSWYNLMKCVSNGHTVVALAHLKPFNEGKKELSLTNSHCSLSLSLIDEQDSMMYQSVGFEGVSLQAEAAGVPLYTRTTLGKTSQTTLHYETQAGDEVEDLTDLLTCIKNELDFEGVSVGAIYSDYQRLRVEHVCLRLQLKPIANLWHRDQHDLLDDVISDGLHAVIIKIASIGLKTDDLGKSLQDMRSKLKELDRKYQMNVCGEGGEYESFTLDCPLFNKKIEM
jgi:diphthine-ammonia ligase